MRSFEEAVTWIQGLQKFGIKPGLERMQWMLERLDYPQRRLKFIHIAGTNGKGSTVQFISRVLEEAGYSVGTFTSPAMGGLNTHVNCNHQPMSEEAFTALVEQRIRPLASEIEQTEAGSLTEFEVLTLLAILYFAEVEYPDFVVWETGLGGRLDSTNVVTPLVSVITNIGYDHMNILGNSLEKIAAEKAGIIKNGFPVITAETNPVSFEVIEQTAKQKKCALYSLGKDFSYSRKTGMQADEQEYFDFRGIFRDYPGICLSMLGEHQVQNAALSVMALEVLRQYSAVWFEPEHLLQGLKKAQWPGRFEIVQKKPFLILDGAHNIEGMRTLLQTARERFPGRKFKVLFSVLADKDTQAIIRELVPICEEVVATEMDHPRALPLSDILMHFRDESPCLNVRGFQPWQRAFEEWYQSNQADDVFLVTGSLYFISTIREALGKAQEICSDFKEKAGE